MKFKSILLKWVSFIQALNQYIIKIEHHAGNERMKYVCYYMSLYSCVTILP